MFAALRARNWPHKRRWAAAVAAALVFGLAVAFWFTKELSGRGEFDPVTLSVRTGAEWAFLGGRLRVPLGERRRERIAGPPTDGPELLFATLEREGHVLPIANGEPRWITIYHGSRYAEDVQKGLYGTLYASAEPLSDWTEANPELARIWWGRGFALLRSDDPAERRAGAHLLGNVWPDFRRPDPAAPDGWRPLTPAEYGAHLDAVLKHERERAR